MSHAAKPAAICASSCTLPVAMVARMLPKGVMSETTIAELLTARADDEHIGLRFEDESWTWAEVVRSARRAAAWFETLRSDGPFHIGVLLENTPEYLFLLGGAAVAGATIVGINPTRRGAELATDIRHTDCQLIVTDSSRSPGRDRWLDMGVPTRARVLDVDGPGWPRTTSPPPPTIGRCSRPRRPVPC